MRTAASLAILGLAALALANPALAFDCAKAATKVEKAICADPAVKAKDDAMTALYNDIKSLSSDAEKKMLARSQKNWIDGRESDCGTTGDAEIGFCIRTHIENRLAALTVKAEGGSGPGSRMIPVFAVQAGGKGLYEIDFELVRFADPKTAGEKRFNAAMAKIFASAPLGKQKDHANDETLGSTSIVSLSYASPQLISALDTYGGDSGGAHPNGGTGNLNIDMATGKELQIGQVFSEAAAAKLGKLCRDQIVAQKREKQDGGQYDPAKDDFLKDDVIAEHIATFSRWSFRADEVTVSFDAYAIGPYTEGEYQCFFQMKDLQAMALPEAPLP